MDTAKFEEFLKSHGIEYKDGKWRMGDVEIDPKTIVKNTFFLQQAEFSSDDALMYMRGKSKKQKKDIPISELTEYTIGIFLDELASPPSKRKYLDTTIPQMVVDPTLRTFPYDKDIPANQFNETDLLAQYQNMMELGKKTWGTIKTTDVMFSNYVRRQRLEQEKKIIAKIKHDPSKIDEADQFLGELYNLYRPAFVVFGDECRYDFEFFKGVIKHLIWNIKTKAWLGVNKYPFMLNLSGDQGNGKTSFVKHLCGDVLQELMSIQNISVLNDSFGVSVLADQWVLFFDEMVKLGGNIDIEKLKQVITSNKLLTRVIFTKNQSTTTIRSVFIGSANRPIYEIINDPTGMRRYLNIEFRNDSIKNCKPLHKVLDAEWEKHGLAIWQSVDESLPYGYLVGKLEQMWDTARTSYLSDSNSILLWMSVVKAQTRTFQCTTGLKLDEAYAAYKEYWASKDKRQQTFNMDGFKKFIKNQYNTRLGKSYTPGELRIVVGVEDSVYMKSPEEEAGDFTTLPTSLNIYSHFVPVDLGPGTHLVDYLVPTPPAGTSASGKKSSDAAVIANAANAPANLSKADQVALSPLFSPISPISDNNKEDIGNIGMMSDSYEDRLREDGKQAPEVPQRQSRQPGDPAINSFEFGTESGSKPSPEVDDFEPTEAEIEWYKENYGYLDELEKDSDEYVEVDDSDLEELKNYFIQLKELRAKRREERERLRREEEAEDEFFRNIKPLV
jgi:hypothetical protein